MSENNKVKFLAVDYGPRDIPVEEIFDALIRIAEDFRIAYEIHNQIYAISVPEEFNDRVKSQIDAWIHQRVKRAS